MGTPCSRGPHNRPFERTGFAGRSTPLRYAHRERATVEGCSRGCGFHDAREQRGKGWRGADSMPWSLAAGLGSSARVVSGSTMRASDGAHNSPLQRTGARRARSGR